MLLCLQVLGLVIGHADLKAAYDSGTLAEQVNADLSFLSNAIHRVQTTSTFMDILDMDQLDEVYCAALNLSAAVTDYLTMAIKYFTAKSTGGLTLRW
jgi:selenophosphate synthase